MKKYIGLLVLACLWGNTSWAAINVVDKTDSVETTLYGRVQEGAILDRVGQIELTLWGQERKGQLNEEIDRVYRTVEADGGTPTLRTRVDMLQWTYNGRLTDGSLLTRLDGLERGVFGRTSTQPVVQRVQALEGVIIGPDKKIVLAHTSIPKETPFKIVFTDPVSSDVNKVGDRIGFTVAEDIVEGDLLVVPEGTRGYAVITDIRKAGSFGRKAHLDMTFHGITTVDGSSFDAEQGQEATARNEAELRAAGASVAGIALLGPVGLVGGFFVKGKTISYPAGAGLYVQPVATLDTYGAGLAVQQQVGAVVPAAKPVGVEASAPVASTTTPVQESNTQGKLAEGVKEPSARASGEAKTTPTSGEAPDKPIVIIKKN